MSLIVGSSSNMNGNSGSSSSSRKRNSAIQKRAKQFTAAERQTLFRLVRNAIPILDAKALGKECVVAKRRCWKKIAQAYNSNPNYAPRDLNQLKKCWENIKSRRKRNGISVETIVASVAGDGDADAGGDELLLLQEASDLKSDPMSLIKEDSPFQLAQSSSVKEEPVCDVVFPGVKDEQEKANHSDCLTNGSTTTKVSQPPSHQSSMSAVHDHVLPTTSSTATPISSLLYNSRKRSHYSDSSDTHENNTAVLVDHQSPAIDTDLIKDSAYYNDTLDLQFKRQEQTYRLELLEQQLSNSAEEHAMKMRLLQCQVDILNLQKVRLMAGSMVDTVEAGLKDVATSVLDPAKLPGADTVTADGS